MTTPDPDHRAARLARLARLDVTPAEAARLDRDLDAILDHVACLDALDLTDVAPFVHRPQVALRPDDAPTETLGAAAVTALAPASADGCVLVPRVLGDGPDGEPEGGPDA